MRIDSCNELDARSPNGRAVSWAASWIALLTGTLLAVMPWQAQASVFTVNFSQVGGNVVANGSGSFNLTGLTLQSSGGSSTVFIRPSTSALGVGVGGFFDDLYSNNASFGPGLVGPTSFGSGGTTAPSSGTTPDFLFAEGNSLVLPQGYVSDAPLTDSSTYTGATFASLGLTPGTYTWTWDVGANSLVLNVPEPASFLLLGAGMVGMAAIRRRRPLAG
jgi:hypothetical protein